MLLSRKTAKIFIVVFSLVIAFFTGINNGISVYALQNKNTSESFISEEVQLQTDYDTLLARLVDDEGNIYFSAYNVGSNSQALNLKILKMNTSGEIVASCDGRADVIKQIGNKIYVFTERYDDDFKTKISGVKCRVYSKNLKLEKTYKLTFAKSCQFADVNSKKVCYLKGEKIYLSDLNGKNEKIICDFKSKELNGAFCQGVALTKKYAAFTAVKSVNNKRVTYCGAVDLETGELQLEEQPLLWLPKSFNETIIWNSNASGSGSVNSGSSQIVVFKDGSFSTVKTKTKLESLNAAIADSDGNIITTGYSSGEGFYRIYAGGKSKKVAYNDIYVCAAANCGILAHSYTVKIGNKYHVRTILIPY